MTSRMRNPARSASILLAVTASAFAIGGCKHTEPGTKVAGWALVDPTQRHPILVSQEPETLTIPVSRHASGLTPAQRSSLVNFNAHYRAVDGGNSRLVIQAPSGNTNEVAAMMAVQEIRALLVQDGLPESDILVEAYHAEGSGSPPVKVSFMRYVAEAPDCGNWSTNLASQPDNLPYPNLGCATQRNFAAQVANPADLLGPRTMTARAAERRDTTWNKYVKGDTTTAQKSEEEKVKVSEDN
ncbi:MAG: CpaD family pilus assembly protein [Hyphomicrobiaceae bacterium]|nr:CpaD family pilus assembly protein [Hyphomicrobiaceae bacterium]